MNPNDTQLVLGIDATARDPMLVDSHADASHPDAALHCRHRKPACSIAHLDENQHALAFEMRDLVAACVAPC